jgi:hypothetical protein
VLSETVLDDKATKENPQAYTSWLNMPPALPDILSSDGRLVYMRSQPFTKEGKRLPLEAMPMGEDADRGAPPAAQRADRAHLFSPTGFLDDTWWHRTYWMYGSTFISGWCGYFKSGQTAPAGRILVCDDKNVYGFGRKPQYYRWTTPIEHQLFSAERISPGADNPNSAPSKMSVVRVAKSDSLNPTRRPLTVSAWVNSDNANGVVLARGGGSAGYVLWLKGGKPNFGVRVGGELTKIAAKQRIVGEWTHLAAVLTPEKQLRLYIDGKLAASGEATTLLNGDPAEALEIGVDEGSIVGDYAGPGAFGGLIDEVRLYRSALSKEDIARLAAGEEVTDSELALAFAFDGGKAEDLSGNENHGQLEGTKPAPGKVGDALTFSWARPTRRATSSNIIGPRTCPSSLGRCCSPTASFSPPGPRILSTKKPLSENSIWPKPRKHWPSRQLTCKADAAPSSGHSAPIPARNSPKCPSTPAPSSTAWPPQTTGST